MKNLLTVLLCFSFAASGVAQNLVSNPNFAQHNDCPDNLSQLTKCSYWYNPTMGSPDYLNACHDTLAGSSGNAGVPDNMAGTQASTSKAYIGVYTVIDASADYREYVQADIAALQIGSLYRVFMKVSLADNSFYATNAPGVFFYNSIDFGMALIYNIPRMPQVDFGSYGNITDKTNWVTVIDTFTADSAYEHMVVGNFNDDASTSKTNLFTTVGTHYGYFYIDSISVEKVLPSSITHIGNNNPIKATLYPNPFTDYTVLNIEQVPGNNNTLEIMNVQGAVVRRLDNISSGQVTIARDGLEAGFYSYRLSTEGGNALNGKMIVQ